MAGTASSIRYIGSKARIAPMILSLIGSPEGGSREFVDLFSGTGVVSREAARLGWSIRANDYLLSSTAMTTAQLVSPDDVPFAKFGGYKHALQELNTSEPISGFIYREYTPSSQSTSGHQRRYFTPENGRRIDGIRCRIEEWNNQGLINGHEKMLLIADLMGAANRVANIAGTYGCFLRHWSNSALRPLILIPRALLSSTTSFEVTNADAFDLAMDREDVAYLDPPYTKRQYPAYYHILETIAAGDSPDVEGVTGLRPWQEKSSPFCYKRKAVRALDELVRKLRARRIYFSYSSEGHMDLNTLESVIGMYGSVTVHELGPIGRYRPNQIATTTASLVREYLVELKKWHSPERGA